MGDKSKFKTKNSKLSRVGGWKFRIPDSEFPQDTSLFRDETQPDECAASGLVLRLSFADPFAAGHLLAIPDDVEDPQAPVVRSRHTDLAVLGQRQSTRLGDLLQ